MTPLGPNERRRTLHHAEADLTWLLTGGNRYRRAVAVLMDSELQAAIIRAQNPGGGRKTEGSTAWSDPTFDAAFTQSACEVRANAIRRVWIWEAQAVAEAVATVLRFTAEPCPHSPTGPLSTVKAIQWLTIAPQNRIFTPDPEAGELAELDHAIRFAAQRARVLRQGSRGSELPLQTAGGQRVPSVYAVLEAARLAMKADPPKPKPVQKPMEGCVSCKRAGCFNPIDTVHHSKRSLCTMCGNALGVYGRLPPVAAIKYVHRTGKRLTNKVWEEAERTERAS